MYRHQLKPVITTGATTMNTIFGQAQQNKTKAGQGETSPGPHDQWLLVGLPRDYLGRTRVRKDVELWGFEPPDLLHAIPDDFVRSGRMGSDTRSSGRTDRLTVTGSVRWDLVA
jgi:hypothetical protein